MGVRRWEGEVLEGSRCAGTVRAGLSRLDYVRIEWIHYGFCQRCFVKCECERVPAELLAETAAENLARQKETRRIGSNSAFAVSGAHTRERKTKVTPQHTRAHLPAFSSASPHARTNACTHCGRLTRCQVLTTSAKKSHPLLRCLVWEP